MKVKEAVEEGVERSVKGIACLSSFVQSIESIHVQKGTRTTNGIGTHAFYIALEPIAFAVEWFV
jgi:hypothetical protein